MENKNTVKQDSHGSVWFKCVGCNARHKIETKGNKIWEWNGDLIKPTFTPSVLVIWDEGEEHIPKQCHSFVKDGQIQYLNDCTHKLAGQTIDLPTINPKNND